MSSNSSSPNSQLNDVYQRQTTSLSHQEKNGTVVMEHTFNGEVGWTSPNFVIPKGTLIVPLYMLNQSKTGVETYIDILLNDQWHPLWDGFVLVNQANTLFGHNHDYHLTNSVFRARFIANTSGDGGKLYGRTSVTVADPGPPVLARFTPSISPSTLNKPQLGKSTYANVNLALQDQYGNTFTGPNNIASFLRGDVSNLEGISYDDTEGLITIIFTVKEGDKWLSAQGNTALGPMMKSTYFTVLPREESIEATTQPDK